MAPQQLYDSNANVVVQGRDNSVAHLAAVTYNNKIESKVEHFVISLDFIFYFLAHNSKFHLAVYMQPTSVRM